MFQTEAADHTVSQDGGEKIKKEITYERKTEIFLGVSDQYGRVGPLQGRVKPKAGLGMPPFPTLVLSNTT